MTTQPVDHERLLVHNWRVARLTRLGIPGRWPRSTPTASTGTRSPGWPCASPADERTRDEGPRLPVPIVLAFLIAADDPGRNLTETSGQHRVAVRVTSVRSLATVAG